jgi:hypothetical protein
MTYAELKAALAIFGLSENDRPTMAQFKRRQRDLARSSHPDLAPGGDALRMQKINAAAAILSEYLTSYQFSFSEEEFYQQNPDEQLRRQFSNDPLWGAS